MAKKLLIISIIIILILGSTAPVLAHGVEFTSNSQMSYEITATYDDGTPLADAQVNVFAPGDPKNAWISGTSDDNGKYVFSPDPAITGTWTVQFRKAGHGGNVNIEVSETADTSSHTGFSTIQIAIITVAVLWGFIGTSLYFKREKK